MDGPAAHAARDERGFGLIEVLLTVAIISIAFVTVLSALSVMIASSAQHRRITQVEAIARNAAEYVKSTDPAVGYTPCATTYDLSAINDAPDFPDHYTVSVDTVKAWDGNVNPASYTATCTADKGAQLVTILVDGPDGDQRLSVVKRSPT